MYQNAHEVITCHRGQDVASSHSVPSSQQLGSHHGLDAALPPLGLRACQGAFQVGQGCSSLIRLAFLSLHGTG